MRNSSMSKRDQFISALSHVDAFDINELIDRANIEVKLCASGAYAGRPQLGAYHLILKNLISEGRVIAEKRGRKQYYKLVSAGALTAPAVVVALQHVEAPKALEAPAPFKLAVESSAYDVDFAPQRDDKTRKMLRENKRIARKRDERQKRRADKIRATQEALAALELLSA